MQLLRSFIIAASLLGIILLGSIGHFLFYTAVVIPNHFYQAPLTTGNNLCAATLLNEGSGDYYTLITAPCTDINHITADTLAIPSPPVESSIDTVTFDADCVKIDVDTNPDQSLSIKASAHPLCQFFAADKTVSAGQYMVDAQGHITKQ